MIQCSAQKIWSLQILQAEVKNGSQLMGNNLHFIVWLWGCCIRGPYIYLDPRRVPPFSLGLAGSRPSRLVAAKPVMESKHQLWPGPADLHLLVGSWKLGKGGIAYVYVWLDRSYDPPEGCPGQQAYTFVIRNLRMSLTSVSIFSVCCCSRYVSQWLHIPVPATLQLSPAKRQLVH